MIYPQRDNKRRTKKIATMTGSVAGVIVLCLILNIWKPQLFTPVIQGVARPILEARGGFLGGLNSVWQFLHTHNQLAQENESLRKKFVLYQAVETERNFYKDEYASLLKFASTTDHNKQAVLARIISKPGFSAYDTMIIDRGTADGLQSGNLVLADQDIILGEVSAAYAHTATVSLYSSPEHETVVLIGPQSIQAVAMGKGGGNFELKLPKNTEIKEGDNVVLASTTTKIIGTIARITTSPTDSFERALFKNTVDVAKLTYIIVDTHK